MIEAILGALIFLPVAVSLIVLSYNIRKEYLYGTDHDVFRRDLFSRKDLSQISAKRDTNQ